MIIQSPAFLTVLVILGAALSILVIYTAYLLYKRCFTGGMHSYKMDPSLLPYHSPLVQGSPSTLSTCTVADDVSQSDPCSITYPAAALFRDKKSPYRPSSWEQEQMGRRRRRKRPDSDAITLDSQHDHSAPIESMTSTHVSLPSLDTPCYHQHVYPLPPPPPCVTPPLFNNETRDMKYDESKHTQNPRLSLFLNSLPPPASVSDSIEWSVEEYDGFGPVDTPCSYLSEEGYLEPEPSPFRRASTMTFGPSNLLV